MPPKETPLPRWSTATVPEPTVAQQLTQDRLKNATEIDNANAALATVRDTLDRLRKWHDWGIRRKTSLTFYLFASVYSKRPPCPSRSELRRLALFFFPSRATGIQVDICDFGDNRFERHETTIDKLEPYFQSKPDWATLRWMSVYSNQYKHAVQLTSYKTCPSWSGSRKSGKPVLLASCVLRPQSNITESFELAGAKAQSPVVRHHHAGRDLSCEATSLRDRQYLQDQLDVFNILRSQNSLMDDFDVRSPSRNEPEVNWSMKKMAKMYDIGTSFWHLCLTDIPWQLGEGTRTSLLDADLGINPASTTVQDQFLSRHPSYENAVLVRSLFQCYHRPGYVLTMSPLAGINYLNKTNMQDLQFRTGSRAANDHASFINSFMRRYRETGTALWPIKSTEWFVLELLTQLLVTPCQSRSSKSIPGIQNAYIPSARELRSRQTNKFQRNDSVNLVREYLACIDELSQLLSISQRKIDFLAKLKRDFENGPSNDGATESVSESDDDGNPLLATDHQTSEVAVQTINKIIDRIKLDHEELPQIMEDLKSSLNDASLPGCLPVRRGC
ncbi:MAG: hypothetical protein Q9168_004835 [Polycauliona sp. 1 TL-2023]